MNIVLKFSCALVLFSTLITSQISFVEARSSGRSGFSSYKSSGSKGLGSYKHSSGGHKSSSSSYKISSPKTYTPKSSKSSSSTGTKVKGYYRKDGTYVRPHSRSSPDSDKSNNFGVPSSSQRKEYKSSSTLPTHKYDYDKDGIRNATDKDDDNDRVLDNADKAQYNPNKQ